MQWPGSRPCTHTWCGCTHAVSPLHARVAPLAGPLTFRSSSLQDSQSQPEEGPYQTDSWQSPGKKLWALKLDGFEAPTLESEDPEESQKGLVAEIAFWACPGSFLSLVTASEGGDQRLAQTRRKVLGLFAKLHVSVRSMC